MTSRSQFDQIYAISFPNKLESCEQPLSVCDWLWKGLQNRPSPNFHAPELPETLMEYFYSPIENEYSDHVRPPIELSANAFELADSIRSCHLFSLTGTTKSMTTLLFSSITTACVNDFYPSVDRPMLILTSRHPRRPFETLNVTS